MSTNLFTVEIVNKAIETMAKAQDKAVKSVAQVIVMALWASNVGFDNKPTADVANALLRNLRKGLRKQQVIDLLQAHGNLAYASGTFVVFDAGKGWAEDEVKAIKIAAANWESFKKAAPEVKVLDAIEELVALVERLEKKDAKKELNHADILSKVKALIGAAKADELVG